MSRSSARTARRTPTTLPEVIFPIVDPRAFVRADKLSTGGSKPDSPNVEGFSYETVCPGVVDAKSVTDVDARLPMPVQWLYIC
jgi:hypothetical protein